MKSRNEKCRFQKLDLRTSVPMTVQQASHFTLNITVNVTKYEKLIENVSRHPDIQVATMRIMKPVSCEKNLFTFLYIFCDKIFI